MVALDDRRWAARAVLVTALTAYLVACAPPIPEWLQPAEGEVDPGSDADVDDASGGLDAVGGEDGAEDTNALPLPQTCKIETCVVGKKRCDATRCVADECVHKPIDGCDEDGEWLAVGGGSFVQGCDFDLDTCERDDDPPQRTVTLTQDYLIHEAEVTSSQFHDWCKVTDDCTLVVPEAEAPIVNVDHAQATAFCKGNDARLCTEAEWEFAARGVARRTYPWGVEVAQCESHANYSFCEECMVLPATEYPGDKAKFSGCLSMGGNAREWVSDEYGEWTTGQITDPTGPEPRTEDSQRVTRGGSFKTPRSGLYVWRRASTASNEQADDIGFRCCKDAP